MKDIEQILRDNKPELPDEGAFLIETNARLSKVEGIKSEVAAQQHRSRRALIIALVAGLAIGCLLTLFVMFFPAEALEAGETFLARAASTIQEYRQYLLIPFAACAIALGMVMMRQKKEVI